MEIRKAKKLRDEWGDKACEHPSFMKETQGMVTECGYVERKTDDYICTVCGAEFTRTEKSEIEVNRV